MALDINYVQRPSDGKFLRVKDLLELADKVRADEVSPDSFLSVIGVTGWGNELRGLGVRAPKKG